MEWTGQESSSTRKKVKGRPGERIVQHVAINYYNILEEEIWVGEGEDSAGDGVKWRIGSLYGIRSRKGIEKQDCLGLSF